MEPLPRQGILLGARRISVVNRFIARAIDLLVAVTVFILADALWAPLGVTFGCGALAFSDGWGEGQSLGKRILGLRVIDVETGQGCSFIASLVRNLPFVAAMALSVFPLLWLFVLVFAVPLLALEVFILATVDSGVRLGDVLANTQVVEFGEELMHRT